MIRTIDDLMAAVPGFRKLRSINAALLRTLLDRQKGECTWCGSVIPKGRSAWCGDGCVKAFKERCDPNYARSIVEKRDAGICKLCGRDTIKSEREWRALKLVRPREQNLRRRVALLKHSAEVALMAIKLTDAANEDQVKNNLSVAERALESMAQHGYARGRWREVDHEVPVCEGGGLCDPSKLRLLCGTCHAIATK